MATYAKLDNGKPVNYARATIQLTPGDVGPIHYASEYPATDNQVNALHNVLDGSFKTGGSTTWERPSQT